jgi:S1-C subfamily serine protease
MDTRTIPFVALLLAAVPAWAQAPAPPAQQTARPSLGVMVEPSGPADRGVTVRAVTNDSPADKAGLKPGDTIVRVGDQAVRDPEGLVAVLARHKVGDQVELRVLRDGAEKAMTVTLGERTVARAPDAPPARATRAGFLGVQSQPLTPQERDRLGVAADAGVVVTDVMADSPADKAGLKRGDVIVRVAGQDVADPSGLRAAVQRAGAGQEIELTLARGKDKKDVTARLEEAPVDGVIVPPVPFPTPGGARAVVPGILEAVEKVRELERKVEALEKRLRDLEKKHGADKP